jgi:hypothetical protein
LSDRLHECIRLARLPVVAADQALLSESRQTAPLKIDSRPVDFSGVSLGLDTVATSHCTFEDLHGAPRATPRKTSPDVDPAPLLLTIRRSHAREALAEPKERSQ